MAMSLPWAFFGLFAGLWKLIVVAAAVAIFVWKKGLWRHPLIRLLRPWVDHSQPALRPRPVAPTPASSSPATAAATSERPARRGFWGRVFGDRWYFLLFVTMVVCLLVWVLARMTIQDSIHSTP